MANFELGEDVKINMELSDSSGDLISTVADVLISIKDPAGTLVVDEAAMTTDIVGKYYFYYLLPSEPLGITGKYSYKAAATSAAGKISIGTGVFSAVKSI